MAFIENMVDAYTFTESSFINARKQKIYTRKYIPNESYDIVLLFLHGVGEHCTRYHEIFEIFASQRVAVYALDHLGHGKSDGNRHDCNAFSEFIDDILEFNTSLRQDHTTTTTRFILGGISFGGLLAAVTAATLPNEWDGLFLLAPAIGVEMNMVLKIQKAFSGILEILAPTWTVVPAVAPQLLSRNVDFVQDYEADPLNDHNKMRVRLALNISRGMKQLDTIRDSIRMPVIVFHGDSDKVTSPTISRSFYETLQSEDKKYVSLNGQWHCLLNEPEREDTIRSIVEWMNARSKHIAIAN